MISSTTDLNIPNYLIGQRIAGGGMSEVFLATDGRSSRQVVVKTARPAADEQTLQRLLREHRLLLAIDHPNVAKVLDCGCVDDRPYLVLEYIQGHSLREMLQPGQPIAWQQAAPILQQLASALSAMHAKCILHRDVKPENVLIDDEGHVKLIDLSIGTETHEVGGLTTQNQFLGTVDYMAPEQRHRIGVDERTDQYSFAAVAFEMLTGHCSMGQFRQPSELNPDLPDSVNRVLLKGLERDPEDRFPSINEFVEALMVAVRAQPRRRNSPKAIVCIAAILIGLVVGGISYIGFPDHASNQTDPAMLTSLHSGASTDFEAHHERQEMTNSLGMKLAWIRAGSFQMGASGDGIAKPFPTEVPKHSVILTRPFWIGTCEVSVEQFRVFVEEMNYQTTSEKWIAEHGRSPQQPIWNDPVLFPARDKMPVCAVSWQDAVEFCKWLSDREGVTYRLPSEAEWEYACRAGTTGPWSCQQADLSAFAVTLRPWREGPSPIGQRRPNPWGLYDMHGNAWEWCQDYYSKTFYSTAPSTDPICSKPVEGDLRVMRGGGYFAGSRAIRSAMRRGRDNSEAYSEGGHSVGFRVVCDESAPRLARSR